MLQENRLSTPARQGQAGILLVSRIDKYRDPFYNMVLEGVDRALDRLGYIAGYDDIRYNGLCQGLSENNLQLDRALHHIIEPGPSGWTPDLGERGCRMLMSQSEKPDAIVCASDRLAIGTMGWLQRHGCQVPADIAVTGFDNIPDAEFTFPSLTTVHVHKVRLGEIAAERLAKRIENPDDLFLKITTPTSLVVRQSCGSERVKVLWCDLPTLLPATTEGRQQNGPAYNAVCQNKRPSPNPPAPTSSPCTPPLAAPPPTDPRWR